MNILAGFFPPKENLTPLTVVGRQSFPASTGPMGVLKYGETPFSLTLRPNPGPILSLPLISAISFFCLFCWAELDCLLDGFSRFQSTASHPSYQFVLRLLRGLLPLPFLDGGHFT